MRWIFISQLIAERLESQKEIAGYIDPRELTPHLVNGEQRGFVVHTGARLLAHVGSRQECKNLLKVRLLHKSKVYTKRWHSLVVDDLGKETRTCVGALIGLSPGKANRS
jgi:hypothetical protein